MDHKEFSGTWKEIWTQKGAMVGSKDDALEIGGWNHTQTSAKAIVKQLSNFMSIKNSDRILEIGCGAGGMAQYLDCRYVGLDYSETSVGKCMEFFKKTAICADANDIPFKDKYFDKCFAYGCFMYFPTKDYVRQVISEMKRVTRGNIFIGELPMKSHEPKHLLFQKKMFEEEGFKVIDGWAEPYTKVRFSAYCDLSEK